MTSWKAVQIFVVYSHKPKIYSLCTLSWI